MRKRLNKKKYPILFGAGILFALFAAIACTRGRPKEPAEEVKEEGGQDEGFPGMPSPDDVKRGTEQFLAALKNGDIKTIKSFRNPVLTGEASSGLWNRDDASSIVIYLCKDLVYQAGDEINESMYRKTRLGSPYAVSADIYARDETILPNLIYARMDGQTFRLQDVLNENPYILYSVRDQLPFRHTREIKAYPSRDGKIYFNISQTLEDLTGFRLSGNTDAYDAKQAVMASMLDKSLTDELHVGLDQMPDGLPLSTEDIQKLHVILSDTDIPSAVSSFRSLCRKYSVSAANAESLLASWNSLSQAERNSIRTVAASRLSHTNVLLSKTGEGTDYVELRECVSIPETGGKSASVAGTASYVVQIDITKDQTAESILKEADGAFGKSWYAAALSFGVTGTQNKTESG